METNKIIEKHEELDMLRMEYIDLIHSLFPKETHQFYVLSAVELREKMAKAKSELQALHSSPAPTESKDDVLRGELIKFKVWFESLSPASKCTVHPPAGSGGCYGLYNMSDEDLINKYLASLNSKKNEG
jgi:hypothetical protein